MAKNYRDKMKLGKEEPLDFNMAPAAMMMGEPEVIKKSEEENLKILYDLITVFKQFDDRKVQEEALKELRRHLLKPKIEESSKPYYSLSEAAALLGKTNRTLLNWIADPEDPFTAEKVNGRWRISRQTIANRKKSLDS